MIGLGRVPSVRLQGWLYDGTPGAFEHALDHVHQWHVAALLGALFLLWLDSRREYLRAAAAALGSAFAAAIGFLVFPAAPPWLAACHGLIGPLERIREHGRSARRRSRTRRSRRASSTTTRWPPCPRCTAPGRRSSR